MTIQPIIDRLRELHAASTPGPWQSRFIWRALDAAKGTHDIIPNSAKEQDWPDAEFIAAAHNHLPEVLAELERSREVLQLITAQCGHPDAAEGCRVILATIARHKLGET